MSTNATENRLHAILAKRTDQAVLNPRQSRPPVSEARAESLENYRRMEVAAPLNTSAGVIGRIAINRQSVKGRMEMAKAVQETQLELVKIEGEAVKRESLAYYRAKSAQIAETMNTYLQEHLLGEENARMKNVASALETAAENFNARLEALEEKLLADTIKQRLAEQLLQQYESTCRRIEADVLMTKYGAGAHNGG